MASIGTSALCGNHPFKADIVISVMEMSRKISLHCMPKRGRTSYTMKQSNKTLNNFDENKIIPGYIFY